MTHLISYSLHRPGQEYSRLYKAIESISGTYWHHTTSAWLVETPLSAKQVYDLISPYALDANDEIVVFRLQGDWYGKINESDGLNWLHKRKFL
ncbi:MAG: Uncharacterized protein G01um101419_145 [Parcubacteria group bacterium Gr01-1014_19]|nr:MAG: Uncharacterized protein G01um101419_145 [Parcubacteria group bacterium Gr01-1014_19]